MGVDIQGWVEVKNFSEWRGVILIDHIYYVRDYAVFAFLFGVHYTNVKVIAKNRGLPNDASQESLTRVPLDSFSTHSWVTWHEIDESGWQSEHFEVGWQTILSMMKVLASHYGDDNVRLVVAFSV